MNRVGRKSLQTRLLVVVRLPEEVNSGFPFFIVVFVLMIDYAEISGTLFVGSLHVQWFYTVGFHKLTFLYDLCWRFSLLLVSSR